MANGCHQHGLVIDDFEQGHVAGVPKGDDQLSDERTCTRLAAGEGVTLQQIQPIAYGMQGLVGKFQVTTCTSEFAVDDELKPTQQVLLGFRRQAYLIAHRVTATLRPVAARALSNRRCNFPTTVAAETVRPERLAVSSEAMPRATNSV